MTLYDLDIVLDAGLKEYQESARLHADLKVAILNAPRCERVGGGLYKIEDFIPRNLIPQEEITPEQKKQRWIAAGKEMMQNAEKFQKKKQKTRR